MLIRALLAFLALPGIVAVLIPLWMAWPAIREGSFRWIAAIPIAAGFGLLVWCAREFYVAGKGTLAPWDPPRHLVSSGAYRVSRNPMYVAVSLMLFGWAIAFSSAAHLVYALLFAAIVVVRVVFFEEPYLRGRHHEEWKRYAARVPRWIFPDRRAVVVAWAAFLILLPIAGLVYEAVADGLAQREFAPPGTLVDIGGRRVHIICLGDGAPIVFFIHSGWGSSLSGSQARERIATRTKVCSYDRSGHGWSDPGPDVASTGSLARDLAVLQDRAKLPSPFVLVSSSIGGLTAELFARQYPERVAGLVFLDAANSLTLDLPAKYAPYVRSLFCTTAAAAHFGLIRLVDPFGMGRETDDARRGAALTYNARVWEQLCAMGRGLPESITEFAQAPPLRPDLPLTVLSASSAAGLLPPPARRLVDLEGLRKELVESHQKLAMASSNGNWAIVPNSEHLIAGSQPDAVADAVLEMLDEIR
jgi:protein-S-isoprenylcysteine O-methyltransferase Ste14/pimeloyl-ACP methyl ester carboxylesterase